jgi:hypothetical protein
MQPSPETQTQPRRIVVVSESDGCVHLTFAGVGLTLSADEAREIADALVEAASDADAPQSDGA